MSGRATIGWGWPRAWWRTAARRAPPRSRCPSRRAWSPASASSTRTSTGSPSPCSRNSACASSWTARPPARRPRTSRRDPRAAGGQRRRARPAGGQDPFGGLPEAEPVRAKAEELGSSIPRWPRCRPRSASPSPRRSRRWASRTRGSRSPWAARCNSFNWDVTLANSKGFAGSYRRSLDQLRRRLPGRRGHQPVRGLLGRLLDPAGRPQGAGGRSGRSPWSASCGCSAVAWSSPERARGVRPADERLAARLPRAVPVRQLSIARRQSFLADKLGQAVGNELVNIVDDGLLVGGRRTVPFDGEGVPSRRSRSSRRAC